MEGNLILLFGNLGEVRFAFRNSGVAEMEDTAATCPIHEEPRNYFPQFSSILQFLRFATTACLAGLRLAILFCTVAAVAQVSVTTSRYDNLRTGQNTQETALTPSNVSATINPNQFGRLFSQSLDGQAYAQPLYVSNLNIAGGTHNVVFVATEADSVYAFDADNNTGANANPLWHKSMLAQGEIAVPDTDIDPTGGCNNITPVIGITSTPVIDLSTNTMYVEAKSENNGTFIHRLHALDITTGAEKFGGPVVISATASGFTFNPKLQLNRPGLLLSNGTVYIAFASHCDISPYHGWVLAYSASNLVQTGVFMTPVTASFNGSFYGAGIWMSGNGVAADSAGNLYFSTGNGTADGTSSNLGDSIVKLSSSTAVADFFTPADQQTLLNRDIDLGSGGVLLLPDQPGNNPHELVQVGKEGKISVIDRDQMTTGNVHYCPNCSVDPIVQEIPSTAGHCSTCPVNGMWSSPAYWNGSVYFWAQKDVLKAFTLSNGLLSTSPAETSLDVYGYPGATPSISANGVTNGIVWSLKNDSATTVLRAHDPAHQLQLLYSSDTNLGRDNAGGAVKFTVPTIANGKVYVGADSRLSIFGQNPPDFALVVSPSSQGFPSGGGSQNYVITISSINNFNAPVAVTLTNLPASATYACSPNPVNGGSGTSTCTVTVGSSAPTGTFTFNINGSGGGINHSITANLCTSCLTLTLSPNSLLFLNQNVGTSSTPQTVTVSNNGTVAISSISASGDFAETNNCGSILAAGATCNIQETFTPAVTGPQGGTLRVEDNATSSPQTVSLTGVASPVKDDALQISGTNCSNCQNQVTYFTIQQSPVYGYTIRPGDFLFFYQFQDGNSIGGITLCFAGSGSCDDDGKTVDQDGHAINADTVQGMTHFRKVDLTPSVGLTVSQISFVSNGPAGPWNILYGAVQIFSADDAIHPIFTTGDNPNIWVFGTTGVTQPTWTIVRNHMW